MAFANRSIILPPVKSIQRAPVASSMASQVGIEVYFQGSRARCHDYMTQRKKGFLLLLTLVSVVLVSAALISARLLSQTY